MSKGGEDCGPKNHESLSAKTDDAFEKEYEELNEVGKGFSPQLDAKLSEAAKFYDMQYAAGQKKRKSRPFPWLFVRKSVSLLYYSSEKV